MTIRKIDGVEVPQSPESVYLIHLKAGDAFRDEKDWSKVLVVVNIALDANVTAILTKTNPHDKYYKNVLDLKSMTVIKLHEETKILTKNLIKTLGITTYEEPQIKYWTTNTYPYNINGQYTPPLNIPNRPYVSPY